MHFQTEKCETRMECILYTRSIPMFYIYNVCERLKFAFDKN